MIEQWVADLTVTEFREIIRTVLRQTLLELLGDPDIGPEVREEFAGTFQQSIVAEAVSRLEGDGL